jgi:hypothetical protein
MVLRKASYKVNPGIFLTIFCSALPLNNLGPFLAGQIQNRSEKYVEKNRDSRPQKFSQKM